MKEAILSTLKKSYLLQQAEIQMEIDGEALHRAGLGEHPVHGELEVTPGADLFRH